jgi:hypothetical protein
MPHTLRVPGGRASIASLALAASCLASRSRLFAQGCMPIRYTSPTLGAPTGPAPNAGQWDVGFTYRQLHADRFYIGHDYRPDAAPGGLPSRIDISTVELFVAYAATSRFNINLGVPIAIGTHSRLQGDGRRHKLSAAGLGDVSLVGKLWVFDPPEHAKGNVALALGVKAPTGQSAKRGTWNTVTGTEQRPLDPSIQLGDGGWSTIVRAEGFQQVMKRTAVYAAGSYLLNPKAHIAATFVTPFGVTAPVAVTDEYSAHAGLTVDALARRGLLEVSAGGRIDGVPVHDLVGGGDDSFRRPGYAMYVEPAVALRLSRPLSPRGSTFTLGVPIRVNQNRLPSALDAANGRAGGGDFAKFLVFAGYAKRL